MIQFERKGDAVHIKIDVDVPFSGTWHWTAVISAGNEWSAGFLINAITTQLGQRLRSIRQRAYDRGWADAKAKRRKQSQVFTTINDL